jgi:hypothetical protein
MGKLIKLFFILMVLGFLGLLGFSYFGDLSTPQEKVKIPVALDKL